MKNAKRQTLVLTDEMARHPFLASLPERVRRDRERFDPRPYWHISKDDVRGFASAYVACTLAILVFLL